MVNARIMLRRDTAANWQAANPVLALGEIGIETDTRKLKVGDGTTPWNDLPYATATDAEYQALQNALNDHEARTDNPHGVTYDQTGAAPASHASQHGAGGSDPVTIAPSQISPQGEASGLDADLVRGLAPYSDFPALKFDLPAKVTTGERVAKIARINATPDNSPAPYRGGSLYLRVTQYGESPHEPLIEGYIFLRWNIVGSEPSKLVDLRAAGDVHTGIALVLDNQNEIADVYLWSYGGYWEQYQIEVRATGQNYPTIMEFPSSIAWEPVPAGAITYKPATVFTTGSVETITNSNGTCVRYPDGTQVCSHTLTGSTAGDVTWTYPAAFVSAPTVQATAQQVGNAPRVATAGSETTTTCKASVWDLTGTRLAETIRLYAIGRWK